MIWCLALPDVHVNVYFKLNLNKITRCNIRNCSFIRNSVIPEEKRQLKLPSLQSPLIYSNN